jgi:tellurite resistance protein
MPHSFPAPAARIPPNLFAIPFGLAGLAAAWRQAAAAGDVTGAVADALVAVAALVYLIVLGLYARRATTVRSTVLTDLEDPVAGPFVALAAIVPMLLAVVGLAPHWFDAGRVVVDVFLVLTVLLGSWLTGQWIYAPLDVAKLHPGYFLPTVAGGFAAALGAAAVHQHRLAEIMFGYGAICWVILGSMILGRLLFGPPLPPALVPTIAIEVAPAAVATLAYLAIDEDRIDAVAAGLAGYGMLMVLAQIRLLPAYVRLKFMPSTWSFTFSWAAVATAGLHWLDDLSPAGAGAGKALLLAAVTLLVGAIAARTVLAIGAGELLPHET